MAASPTVSRHWTHSRRVALRSRGTLCTFLPAPILPPAKHRCTHHTQSHAGHTPHTHIHMPSTPHTRSYTLVHTPHTYMGTACTLSLGSPVCAHSLPERAPGTLILLPDGLGGPWPESLPTVQSAKLPLTAPASNKVSHALATPALSPGLVCHVPCSGLQAESKAPAGKTDQSPACPKS